MEPSMRLDLCCGGFIRTPQVLTIAAAHLKPGFSEHGSAAPQEIRQLWSCGCNCQ